MTPVDRRARLAATRVYLVVTSAVCAGPWEEAVRRALRSGAIGAVQLREKDVDDATFLARAAILRALARAAGALTILNDRAHLVVRADADGVHVGEDDVSVAEARRLVGPDRLVGVSTHGPAEVAAFEALDADYAGLGPCFPTRTKALARRPGGPALVRACVGLAARPIFPIGGITPDNVATLSAAGAGRVAVGAGILGAADPEAAARAIEEALAAPRSGAS